MTKIEQLNKVYYQKSKLFLYPLLEIKRNGSVTPLKTFFCWEGKYNTLDRKLIVVFRLREDDEYKVFDKTVLKTNERFEEYYQVEKDGLKYGIYIFSFKSMFDFEAYGHVAAGKYSELNLSYKKQIERFFANNKKNLAHIRSYLYPSKYYEEYAELLTVPSKRYEDRFDKEDMETQLKRTGELCSRPDYTKETLKANLRNL